MPNAFDDPDIAVFLDRLNPDATEASDALLQPALRRLAGRHSLRIATPEAGTERRLTLRIGAAGLDVSGDVFGGVDEGKWGRYELGAARDWHYSFHGRVIDSLDGVLLVRALVTMRPRSGRDWGHQTALISLRPDGNRLARVAAVVVGLDTDWQVADHWRSLAPGQPPLPHLRRITLRCALALPEPADALIRRTLLAPDAPFSLARALARTGIEARIETVRRSALLQPRHGVRTGEAARDFAVSASYLADDQIEPARDDGFQPDWDHVMVFCDLDPDSAGSTIGGRSFNIDSGAGRFQSRFAGVINHADVMKARIEPPADAPPTPDLTPDQRQLAWELRQLTLHELGHLLNLPHPWVRDQGHRLLGEADPGAITVTNYGSQWALGKIAECHIERGLPDPDRRSAARRARRQALRNLLTEGRIYDAAELRFLHHAPLDQIARGGRTFRDSQWTPPALRLPGKELEIVALFGDEDIPRAIHYLDHRVYEAAAGLREEAPLPVALRATPAAKRAVHNLTRPFASGTLQVVLQPLRKVRNALVPGLAPARLVDPVLGQPEGWRANDRARQGLLSLPWIRDWPLAETDFDRLFALQVHWFQTEGVLTSSNILVIRRRTALSAGAPAAEFAAAAADARRAYFEALRPDIPWTASDRPVEIDLRQLAPVTDLIPIRPFAGRNAQKDTAR